MLREAVFRSAVRVVKAEGQSVPCSDILVSLPMDGWQKAIFKLELPAVLNIVGERIIPTSATFTVTS